MRISSYQRTFTLFFITLCAFGLHVGAAQAATIPLTNPGAEAGTFTGWTAVTGGDPWLIVEGYAHTGTKSFVSSYLSGTLNIVVDLVAEGYTTEQLDAAPEITAGTWVSGFDSGSGTDDHYDFELELQGAEHGAMVTHSFGDQRTTGVWTQISRTLSDYGPGLRYVSITATGQDSSFWAGNYGAAFDDFTLTVGGGGTPPSIATVSPVDGAATAPLTSVTITFDDIVTTNTGNITIYRADTDAIVSTIDVTTGAVTGSGTSAITITPPQPLSPSTNYYIHIDNTAFRDASNNTYYGIANEGDWNFRTQSSGTHAALTVSPVDYLITNLHTTIDTSTSSALLTWTRGDGAPFSRVLVSTDGITWTPISDFLRVDNSFEWNPSAAFLGKTVTFKVQATDLLTELASAVSDSVLLGIDTADVSSIETTPSAQSGSIIRADHDDTVYYIDATGHRRPLPDTQTYFTWESSFDTVQTVTEADLAEIPLGPALSPKPGTVLVKIQSVPKVFAIDGTAETPVLRWITSEAIATSLYGAHWADSVIDIPPTMWSHFTIGNDINSVHDSTASQSLLRREDLHAM